MRDLETEQYYIDNFYDVSENVLEYDQDEQNFYDINKTIIYPEDAYVIYKNMLSFIDEYGYYMCEYLKYNNFFDFVKKILI